ncbi:proteasome maturation protein [Apis mellifera caucasica]|uniref:Proteasome maturation protein n=1 Tax=Apis mellifera TaxID=7460 RepID=A0A7M7RAM8_APIME|nr:proteasome maturation protein [Apis mellifera]KAG6804039.1 proteasome maturation protein [Apis mellifera caucasica]KAG9437056.1 proteasome maturation protein [Apis mellifera carnica]|eukprot:XP_623807.3 proteasome maturation protein [Apis mellifera]
MSFGLPSLIPKPVVNGQFNIHDDNYGIPNPMISGLSASRQHIGYAHPLEISEKNYEKNRTHINMVLLRNSQGLHAPMRLAMELKATEKIGRLPFLPSSNMMKDVLLGKDEEIGFEDILNISEFREQMGQPHAVIEKSLGIL